MILMMLSFVELAVVENGTLKSQVKNTQYNMIGDEIARRTYDESGDYTINPFSISVKESLNNNLGNNGVYKQGQFSYQGTLASEDLAQYAISPGKAYVKGYEVETISTTYLELSKKQEQQRLMKKKQYNIILEASLKLMVHMVFLKLELVIPILYL